MTMLDSVQGWQTSPAAVMFTNMRGQIIFVDKQFLRMLKYTEQALVGVPFHKVLGIEVDMGRKLLQDMAETGYVDACDLQIQATDGGTLLVSCSGIATYDENGKFLGADMTLRDITSDASLDIEKAVSADKVSQQGLKIDVQDVQFRAQDTSTPLAQYFETQIKALESALGQIGGNHLVSYLETTLNETAARHNWSLQIVDSTITAHPREAEPEVYRALLSKAVNYGVSVIGESMIARRMRSADDSVDAHVLELAEEHGLRELFKRLSE
jgi:PAS domain S-box-containing protein